MSIDPKFTVSLDRVREIRWTMRAEAKLGRLSDPPPLADIASRNPRRGFFALLAYLWAAVEDPAGDFGEPEDMAELLKEPAAQAEAFASLIGAMRAAGVLKPEKKTESTATPPDGASSTKTGHTPSSSSTPPGRRLRR